MNEEIKFYFCYDPNLADKLKQEKQKLITVAIAPSTNKTFWLYQRTNELTAILDEYFA